MKQEVIQNRTKKFSWTHPGRPVLMSWIGLDELERSNVLDAGWMGWTRTNVLDAGWMGWTRTNVLDMGWTRLDKKLTSWTWAGRDGMKSVNVLDMRAGDKKC